MSIETLAPIASTPTHAPADPRDVFHEISPMHRAVNADWHWLKSEFEAGRLESLMDKWVVVLDRRIVDSGPNGHEMRMKAAADFNVHKNRIVLAYVAPEYLIG